MRAAAREELIDAIVATAVHETAVRTRAAEKQQLRANAARVDAEDRLDGRRGIEPFPETAAPDHDVVARLLAGADLAGIDAERHLDPRSLSALQALVEVALARGAADQQI